MATIYDFNMDGGDWTGWTAQYTDGGYLIIEAAAKYSGSYGVRVQTHDLSANPIYSYITISSTKRIRMRYYLNIEYLTLANYNTITIANIASAATQVARMRIYNSNGTYQIYAMWYDDTSTGHEDTYYNITKTGWHYYEWDLKFSSSAGANDGFSQWWVDGTLKGDISGLDNDTHSAVYPSYGVRWGFNTNDTGYIYMDEFKANNDGSAIGGISAGETLSVLIDPTTSFKDGLRVI